MVTRKNIKQTKRLLGWIDSTTRVWEIKTDYIAVVYDPQLGEYREPRTGIELEVEAVGRVPGFNETNDRGSHVRGGGDSERYRKDP